MVMRRDEWSVRIESRTRLTATTKLFQFSGDVEAFEGDTLFDRRVWNLSVPRRLV
jgi:hypothetical protein